MAFLKLTTDKTVKRLRWLMVAASLLDTFSTLLGQPNTYWVHPQTAEELSSTWRHSLSRGWPIYCLNSLIVIVLAFLIVSIIPRRIALFAIFCFILGHLFGASSWLCYHWHFGTRGVLIYCSIFSAALVLLAFPKAKATDDLLSPEPDAAMGTFRTTMLIVCVTLVLVADSWRTWTWQDYSGYQAFASQFRLEKIHTNDTSVIVIFHAKTKEPIWMEIDSSSNVSESYFFQGKDTFDVTSSSNQPPRYGVFLRGPGKSVTWWLDRLGSGSFNERIFYGTNGDLSNHEVWLGNAWQSVDRRDGTNGLVVDGNWHRIVSTNGTWTIKGAPGNQ